MPGTLVIRADAGPKIGTGHLMRTLALAAAWHARGGRVRFLSVCPASRLCRHAGAMGFAFQPLDQPHPHPSDLDQTLLALEQARAEDATKAPVLLVLDGYHFDTAYAEAVRRAGFRVVAVDDLGMWAGGGADVVINQNLGAESFGYGGRDGTVCLLGTRFSLLRPEFTAHRWTERVFPQVARRILVTMGGADPDNVTARALDAIGRLDLPDAEAKIVVGAANPHVVSIRAKVTGLAPQVQLVHNPENMPQLMAWADVALSAAGSTCWELAHMGLPAAVVVLADNQEQLAERLEATGAVTNLGWGVRLTPGEMAQALGRLCLDRAGRMAQNRAGQRIVDGQGAQRAAAIMQSLDGTVPIDQIRLRRVCRDDMHPLWRLANETTVRSMSLSRDRIPWETHERWFQRMLADPGVRAWVLDHDGLVLGQIRYEVTGSGAATISLSVAQGFRGQGLGTRLLQATWRSACRDLRVERILAIVRIDNQPSHAVFAKADFLPCGSCQLRGHHWVTREKRASLRFCA